MQQCGLWHRNQSSSYPDTIAVRSSKKTNKQQLFGISSQGETSPCLSPYSLDTSLGLRCSDYCKLEGLRVTNLFLVRKKKNTWNSTVAGILSSGCPEYFKSGQKEFNKETGWWGLQENIAPSIKLTGTGVDQVFFYHTWGFKQLFPSASADGLIGGCVVRQSLHGKQFESLLTK